MIRPDLTLPIPDDITAAHFIGIGGSGMSGLAGLFLRFEDWLTARASARALYRMDDAALHDIALSRSDVERVNSSARKALWGH